MPDIPLADAQLSLYRNSFYSTPIKTITLAQILQAIRTGRYQPRVEKLRQILAREGKSAYDRAKAYLPAVTFGGTFLPKRGNTYLQQHSGIIHADMDHLTNVVATKQALRADPRVVYIIVSPSATGLKTGVRGPIIGDDTSYKYSWQVISAEFERLYGVPWDPSGKDVSRLCFISHDPEIYWNPNAVCFDVPPPPVPAPKPTMPARTWQAPSTDHNPRDYGERATKTATEMIQAAQLGTRHNTRLKAARLLGGYVAGGLLTEDQAYGALASALVGHTEDLERALKTVEDGLAYGKAHPITLDDLEAERQAWIDAHRPTTPKTRQTPVDDDPWAGLPILPLRPSRSLRVRKVGTHG